MKMGYLKKLIPHHFDHDLAYILFYIVNRILWAHHPV